MTHEELLLKASMDLARQQRLITTLMHENSLLRQRISDRADFDLSADYAVNSIKRITR